MGEPGSPVTPRRLTASQIMARQVSEEQHMNDVMYRMRLAGLSLIYHVPDSRRVSSAGFPDVVACGFGRLIAVECKKVGGVVSSAQRAWLNELGKVPGVETLVATPEDWPAIEALLPINREGQWHGK